VSIRENTQETLEEMDEWETQNCPVYAILSSEFFNILTRTIFLTSFTDLAIS